jgi:hypothetical protein
MISRASVHAFLFCMPVILTSCCDQQSTNRQNRTPKAPVSISLVKATAEPLSNVMLFICDAVIDNDTGHDLTVRSRYHSAFDYIEIVVVDEKGHKLAQQSYHQSASIVSVEPRDYHLKEGKNARELKFAVAGLPLEGKGYRILFVGQLPGAELTEILCSDLITPVMKE